MSAEPDNVGSSTTGKSGLAQPLLDYDRFIELEDFKREFIIYKNLKDLGHHVLKYTDPWISKDSNNNNHNQEILKYFRDYENYRKNKQQNRMSQPSVKPEVDNQTYLKEEDESYFKLFKKRPIWEEIGHVKIILLIFMIIQIINFCLQFEIKIKRNN